MSDRTDPQVELLQDVPTRLADIRELERQLVASAASEDDLDAQARDGLADDELPTTFIALPRDDAARAGHPTERVPVATVITGAPRPRFHTFLKVLVGLGVACAINAALLVGLLLHDETDTLPPAVATVTSVSAPEAEDPPPVASPRAEASSIADVDVSAVAPEQERDAPADPASLDRLRARVMVLRGDGAAAVPALREMTAAYRDDGAIWLAFAQVLAQAEEDAASERAFLRVLELDEHDVHAHVGLARLATRAARLRRARQHLASAREAYELGTLDSVVEARLHVTEGIIGFELGDYAGASSRAERALALDEQSSEAHLLLGRIAIERDQDPTEHLRAAVAGRAPPAEARGMLVPRAGEDACALADRYLLIAPSGYDAHAVRRTQRGCP